MALTIKTNRQWRQFAYRDEVPQEVLDDQFDYQDPEETFDNFFEYRGIWYHLDQFMRLAPGSDMGDWDGAAGDSYFSGVLIKVSDDGEEYQIGTYYS